MRRKIPKSKKHKKLKFVDPSYKGPPPKTKKKHIQVNEPPENEDQEMPSGIEEIINFQKNPKLKKRKKKKSFKDDFIVVKNNIVEKEPGMERELKTMPKVVQQRKNENQHQFFNRLQKMVDSARAEAKVEEKYNIDLVSVNKDGTAQYKEDKKDSKKREKRKRYKEKIQAKKKVKHDDDEFELKKEVIQFGEVAVAPPTFSSRPRNAPQHDKPTFQSNELKKAAKLKDLTLDKRKEMEDERTRAIQMYRLLKNKKTNT